MVWATCGRPNPIATRATTGCPYESDRWNASENPELTITLHS